MRNIIKSVLALSSFYLVLLPITVFADDVSEANRLLRAGQYSEALQKVESALSQRPKDPQIRFLKGLILAEQNKSAEAIVVFTKLSEDHPELPEPYNNLAVLYASSGQYDKARAALELAIRTNPTYGTAHENLGDVYAKLASQAYDKALQLDSSNSAAKLKLTLVRNLIGNATGGTNPKPTTPTPPPTPIAVQAASTKPALVVVNKAESELKAKAELEVKAKPSKVEAKADKDEEQILSALEAWAKAWSNKDTDSYLNFYASDFQTPKGISRKAWSDERHLRIDGKGHINIKIEAPKVSIDGNSATVKFRQIYTSDKFTANSRKELIFTRKNGKWQISQERSGN